jgi:hypothetical protein
MQEVRGNMSHVDDGTLHAYLDGELTPVERARLEGHVAECAACRNRLEEERALIERASGLLGLAQPPERAAPPLHQLRRPSVVWRLRVPVAWAATVVLALGIGYYAGGTPGGRAAPQPLSLDSPLLHSAAADSAARVSRQENEPLAYSAGERRQVVATPRPPAAAERERRADSAPALARRENDALGLVATQTRPGAPQEAKQAAPEPQLYIDGVPVRSLLDSASAQSGVIAIRARDSARTPPASAPVAGAQRAALPTRALEEAVVVRGRAASNAAADRGALVATQWPIIRRGPARQILGAEPMGVPGLAVRNIRRSPTGEVVLVEQAIDSVTVIQLFQQRVESDAYLFRSFVADSLRSGAVATERLARFIGGVRVEIAGPLSADSLNRLLEQVKPIGP